MTCHGTVIAGKDAQDVDIGVSCESCHGAGSGYKDVHAEGDPVMGMLRPGYLKGLQAGMVENNNLTTRARTCTKCHDIASKDRRLVAAGHPDGQDFDYIRGMRKLRPHWKHDVEDAGALRLAFASVLRAPVAAAAPVTQPAIATPGPARRIDSTATIAIPPNSSTPIQLPPKIFRRIETPAPRDTTAFVFMPPPMRINSRTLPPFPIIPDSLSDKEKAEILKRHIDLLLKYYQGRK